MLNLLAIKIKCQLMLHHARGVIFLFKDSDNRNRVVTSLTVRVILSILLIAILIIGYMTGQIQPHGF